MLAGLFAVTRSMTSPVTVTSGIDFTILALIVAVVGGLGSVSGALLAGVLLGVVNTVSSFYIGSYITTIVLLLAAAITIVAAAGGPARAAGDEGAARCRAAGVRPDRGRRRRCWRCCRCATATRAR